MFDDDHHGTASGLDRPAFDRRPPDGVVSIFTAQARRREGQGFPGGGAHPRTSCRALVTLVPSR
jgi:hypothetical protein